MADLAPLAGAAISASLLTQVANIAVTRAQARKTGADAGQTIVDTAARVVGMLEDQHRQCQRDLFNQRQYTAMLAAAMRSAGIHVPDPPPLAPPATP